MSLRVIAGTARGMKLKPVPGDSTRPIMDRVKESLFNIIGDDIIDVVFLDLFGGTGSVGIEALSRGAEHCVFVDLNRNAIKTIQNNLSHTKLKDKATIIQRNAFHIVEREPDQQYHYVYVAPPQYKDIWLQVLTKLDQNFAWHDPDTVIIVQIDPKEYIETTEFNYLSEYDKRKYGRTLLVFYEFTSKEDSTDLQETEN